jgi:hypothetical protein
MGLRLWGLLKIITNAFAISALLCMIYAIASPEGVRYIEPNVFIKIPEILFSLDSTARTNKTIFYPPGSDLIYPDGAAAAPHIFYAVTQFNDDAYRSAGELINASDAGDADDGSELQQPVQKQRRMGDLGGRR